MIMCRAIDPIDDRHLFEFWAAAVPRVGEFIWQSPLDAGLRRTSWRVVEVAHWIDTKWSPTTHGGTPIHTAALYVESVT